MRARNIKPGFFDDENLAGLGPYAQLLFAGLWCLADRDGKLDDRPARIKAHIFPYYEPKPNVITLLDKLCHCHFIQRYRVGDGKYIKVLKFKDHQHPHPHEAASKIPDPENINNADVMACHDHEITLHGMSPKCQADSLIPDSLIPDSLITPSVTSGSGSQQEDFDCFWSAYPKKCLVEKMLFALEVQRKWPEWNKDGGQYIPRPSTWLNQKRWEDEITVEGQSAEETYMDKKLKDIGYTGGPGHDDYARNAG
jgi:hypothetical protein